VDKKSNNLILIVDDLEDDQLMLEGILHGIGVGNPILRLPNGHEAMRYLNGDAPYNNRINFAMPAVIFLDLKMPIVSGWEVLDWLHGLSMKGSMLVFIYSELQGVEDVKRLYRLGADSFLAKPLKEIDVYNLLYHFPRVWEFKVPSDAGPFSEAKRQ
jgi:CheY-like chemotaxis protein